jgi:Peptidase family S41
MKSFLLLAFSLYTIQLKAQQNIWQAKVTTVEYGLLKTNFFMSAGNEYLQGTTSPNASKRILGSVKAMFAKDMFQKNASIIELDSISIINNVLTGYFIMEHKKYWLQGNVSNNTVRANITGKISGRVYGTFEATISKETTKPNDYVRLWDSIKVLTEEKIYKKNVLETKAWKNFTAEMESFAAIAEDDAEFAYGFYYFAKNLPFTHFVLMGNKDSLSVFNSFENKGVVTIKKPELTFINSNTALLNVPKFNFRKQEIDSLLQKLVTSKVDNLIIDLRNNSGGDMEGGMHICSYLFNQPMFGGIMLTQYYWNNNTQAPATETYSRFKLMNMANYEWFKQQVKTNIEGLCLKTEPQPVTFSGKVYVLTSGTTASSSEPVVYTLQQQNRAVIIGEKTAGAVISMEPFNIHNLTITIPMLDYYTADGKRLDKTGVVPDVLCKREEALQKALELIRSNETVLK